MIAILITVIFKVTGNYSRIWLFSNFIISVAVFLVLKVIFDFIYSKDTANGIVEIIKSDFEGCINLGSGKSTKISEVILYLKKKFPKING